MSFLFNESGPFQKGGLIFPVSLLMLVWRFKLEGKPTLKSHDSININMLFKCIISGNSNALLCDLTFKIVSYP